MTSRAASPAITPARVALLLCASGACALAYQVAWLRLLRLLFGASTAASAAVLAIFLGGLGLGALLFGGRADRAGNPLRLYAQLELGVALTAALSPLLIAVARFAYIGLGGSAALGGGGATLLRLVLSVLVLGLPTPLMGGTLPAAVRAVEVGGDLRRRRTGLLYAMNTLGAVAGALAANFALLEWFGTRATIWCAAALNLVVALVALRLAGKATAAEPAPERLKTPAPSTGQSNPRAPLSKETVDKLRTGPSRRPRKDGASSGRTGLSFESDEPTVRPEEPPSSGGVSKGVFARKSTDSKQEAGKEKERRRSRDALPSPPRKGTAAEVPAVPTGLILTAAGVVGFAFVLMELVWYRMLAPLLGGSSYTFGLILAVALLGIGVGGLAYAAGDRQRRPTLTAFALTCALEAVLIALPYALGDGVAVIAVLQHPPASAGFAALVRGWLVVTMLVVFPAALIAGYQFPLLIGLLGSGERDVGQQVAWAYATNTGGAIVGSLAGGFGLLPLLSAPGAWRAVVYLLAACAAAAAISAARAPALRRGAALSAVLALAAVVLCWARGPTAFWRHTPIGAGRDELAAGVQANGLREVVYRDRATIEWEAEGVESSVALHRENGLAFVVNGKTDGNAMGDAATQVMLGLIGAAFHPHPQRALVVGLGTGETAGWLAQVPSIERVDVLELEPSIVHIAELCAAVNGNALANPKVHLILGDAREFLLTGTSTYDVIASEPSNPYRAGTASLFTKEFYAAVAARLTAQGVFAQWVQAYEVQADTVRSIYATLGTVFPSVETWETILGQDLAFLARKATPVHDIGMLRGRLEGEPYQRVLPLVWAVGGVEGLLTGFAAGEAFAKTYPADDTALNTDDRTVLEYQFARSVGKTGSFSVERGVREIAHARDQQGLQITNGAIDWAAVEELRAVRAVAEGNTTKLEVAATDAATLARMQARAAFGAAKIPEARRLWLTQTAEPQALGDVRMVAEILADSADERATGYIEALRHWEPASAEALLALWHQRANAPAAAAEHLVNALRLKRQDPWSNRGVLERAVKLAQRLIQEHPELRPAIVEALSEPFALWELDYWRKLNRGHMAAERNAGPLCLQGIAPFEPEVPWSRPFLEARADCYQRTNNPLAERARADLDRFRRAAGVASGWTDLVGVGAGWQ